jgi:hypothetical protein
MDLKIGQVFHLWCSACNPQKYKFFVLASINPGPWFFLINSEPTEFQKSRAHLLASMVELTEKDVSFLSHDSWLDCTGLMGGHSAESLETMLESGAKEFLGRLDSDTRRHIRAVVSGSKVLTGNEKEHLLRVW